MPETTPPASSRDNLLSPVGYLRALVANVKLIIGGTALAGVAGVVAVLLMPVQFSSSATLFVSPQPFRQAAEVSALMPANLGVVDYRILFTSDGILMRAAERVGELGSWTQEELEDLQKISQLRKMMTLVAEVSQKTVSTTEYSPMITLTATADTPDHARDLVLAWAQVCEEVSRQAYEKGKSGLLNIAQEQFNSTRGELETVGGQIRDAEIEYNDELARAQLMQVHERYLDYIRKTADKTVEIETTRKEIAELEQGLLAEPERLTLFKSPPMTAVFMDKAKSKSGEPEGYSSEELNAVHVALKEKLVVKRSELASMEEFVRQMTTQLESLSTELQQLRAEIAEKAFERKMLNIQETPHLRSYDMLSGLLEQAKIVESERLSLGDVKIISDPVLPDRKSWPPRTLFVLLAAFSGLCVSTAAVLLRQALSSEEFALVGK
ncbi:MAG: G-rich domain on putative tyrosine kinase [Candidatus Hydrogenedentota bacterium]|jgi:uncharacterized protein involved in exopolysaccharide biosynthesis